MSDGLVLTVPNQQCEDCGKPPALNAEDFRYCGYFVNEYGEQAVFVRRKDNGHCFLYMGDWHWENPLRVIAGIAPGIMLNGSEAIILNAMWGVATKNGTDHSDGEQHEQLVDLLHGTGKGTLAKLNVFSKSVGNVDQDEEEKK